MARLHSHAVRLLSMPVRYVARLSGEAKDGNRGEDVWFLPEELCGPVVVLPWRNVRSVRVAVQTVR